MRIKSHAKSFLILFTVSILVLGACAPFAAALPSATPSFTPMPPTSTPIPTATATSIPAGYRKYVSKSGDTLAVIAARAGIEVSEIIGVNDLPQTGLIDPGTALILPDRLGATISGENLVPDSDVVFSPSASQFDVQAFVTQAGGNLAGYSELVSAGTVPGGLILADMALENSINPRILLSVLEFESGWVHGTPTEFNQKRYPMGYVKDDQGSLYKQAVWAIRQLSLGYYGWRAGTLVELTFKDGSKARLSPDLNAGTVAVMFLLAQIHTPQEWQQALYGGAGLPKVHTKLFGDAWARAAQVEPLLPAGTTQPELGLPFSPGKTWNYTCGPHSVWGKMGPAGALDFAPGESLCGGGDKHWVTAMADGQVLRTGNGVVIQELDEDGDEHSGWVLLYMHVSSLERVAPGTLLAAGERVGHPSCEGGSSSGTHVHVARRLNGEWLAAEGGLPFILSGFQAFNGEKFCYGSLEGNGVSVPAYPWGSWKTKIVWPQDLAFATPPFATLAPAGTPAP